MECAILVRKMQARGGHPNEKTIKGEASRMSNSSIFKDCPITTKDSTIARNIFSPSLSCIEGKWMRGRPDPVRTEYAGDIGQVSPSF